MIDTLVVGGHLLTKEGDGIGFVENGAAAIEGRRFVAVGPRDVVESAEPARTTEPGRPE